MSSLIENNYLPDPSKHPWICVDIQKIENDASLLPFSRKLILEMKKNKGYANISNFFKNLSREEVDLLKQGLVDVSQNKQTIFSKSVYILILTIAMAEGSPCVFTSDLQQYFNILTLLLIAHSLALNDLAIAIYENFKITGFSSWDVVFIEKQPTKENSNNESDQPKTNDENNKDDENSKDQGK